MPPTVSELVRPAADPVNTDVAAMSDVLDVDALPTSFGVFKPVGYVMVGLPNQARADALVLALHAANWPPQEVLHFAPRKPVSELTAMVNNAGALAGFGYEITLLRRYLEMSKAGCRWLLVRAVNSQQAADAADLARRCGATLAIHYRALTVEELLV